MVRELWIGPGTEPVIYDPVLDVARWGKIQVVHDVYPSLYNGLLTTFKITIDHVYHDEITIVFNTYRKQIMGSEVWWEKKTSSNQLIIPSIYTEDPPPPYENPVEFSLTGQNVSITAGDYLGMSITPTTGLVDFKVISGVEPYNPANCIYIHDDNSTTFIYPTDTSKFCGYLFPIEANGWESGNVSPDTCQESEQIPLLNAYWGWGVIEFMDADCSFYPYLALVHVLTPWTEYITNEVLVQDIQKVYEKPGSNPKEYYGLTANLISCLEEGALQLTECWWRESDIYYVKNGGSDSNFGVSWASAFATISKAATKVPAGGRAYIGFGTYNSETNITPTALGANPIRYYPCTPNSTGGTGSVVINL